MLKALLLLAPALLVASPRDGGAATYYVRQTVGNDANDGLSPKTAWQHIAKLSAAMHAGDTAYVGPGLYRDEIRVARGGTAENRVAFVADTAGHYTGDPPGVVMITGAEPVDESIFVAHSAPGVYSAPFSACQVQGVVEMDGDQYKYASVKDTKEYAADKVPGPGVVAKHPSSFFYDDSAKVLYLHTSDGKPPGSHEVELICRSNGISIVGRPFVSVEGFTFRHSGFAGVSFFNGAADGMAVNNTSYGSHQGIQVYSTAHVTVKNNVLFRNENSGAYFAKESANGQATSNVAYENIKGLRWSSESTNGQALDNVLFDNHERGIAIENTNGTVERKNRVVNNKVSQLLVLQSKYDSDENCFAGGSPEQLIADFYPFPLNGRYKTLAEYQQNQQQDLHSREGDCGPLPAKVDVRKLHAETMAYTERARKILNGSVESSSTDTQGTE